MYEALKKQVCLANLALVEHRLVIFTWGNVSAIDRDRGVVAIKPSGVEYDALSPDKIVLLDLNGNIVEGNLRPSSDTPTHLELYSKLACPRRDMSYPFSLCHDLGTGLPRDSLPGYNARGSFLWSRADY